MKSIELTSDKSVIKDIIKEYYDLVTFDGCPSFEDFIPDTENSIWFVLYDNCGTQLAGLIKLESVNFITWTPHIVIKKEYRKNNSEQWGLLVAAHMKEKIADVNFMVITPYKAAKDYAKRMGFKLIGIMPKSMKKNGKLMDQYVLSGYPDKGEIV
jgi:hypothetical protein